MNIDDLLKENRFLKEENQKLRELLKGYGYIFDDIIKLNALEKIKMYRSYFRGRDDIFARYYIKSFYIPCYNRNKKDMCYFENGRKKCSKCHNADFIALSDEIIKKHIKEKDHLVGLYPLLKDNTCYLLAIDFDEDDWFDAMLSVYRVAKRYGIDCLMERSKSGNGGHLWIFFESAIESYKARKLGFFLLNEAMKVNKDLSYSSFDRMFPNQDTLPIGGFGNLIVLPLQYDAINNINTLFIDENGMVIKRKNYSLADSQFAYLASIRKMDIVDVDKIIQISNEAILSYGISETMDAKINKEIKVIENTMLKIYRLDLNAITLNIIKKLATVWNPEYFKLQKMHRPIYYKETPAVLSEFEVSDEYIYIPRGLKEKMIKTFNQRLIIHEYTNIGNEIDVSFKGELFDYQNKAVQELTKHNIGILESPTGSGKTVMALSIIAKYKISTLIVLPSKELLKQWKCQIDNFLEYPKTKLKKEHYIGEYTGNKKRLKGKIDVATIQSLININEISKLQQYGLVIIDECHHVASNTYRTLIKNINAKRIYGFTATPQRQDGQELITNMYLGEIVFKIDEKDIVEYRNYDQVLIPRFTSVCLIEEDRDFNKIIDILCKNQKRNHLIINDVIKEFKENRNIIILSDRIEHLKYLYEQLIHVDENVYLYLGETKKRDKEKILEHLKYANNFNYILLASCKLIGEGFDLPNLETMFMATPFSWKGRTKQYSGRLHRTSEGKELVRVYDYVDHNILMLNKMFNKRLKIYLHEGYKLLENDHVTVLERYFYSNTKYYEVLRLDMLNAKKEIIIFSSKIKISRIKQIYNFIQELLYSGINIVIIVKKVNEMDDVLNYLNSLGVKIIFSEINIDNLIIDNRILWLPNTSYLEKQSLNSTAIRLDSVEIIEEIINDVNKLMRYNSN